MIIDEDLASYLLASIETNRLVAVVGAGLSMSSPSLTPSAEELLDICKVKYQEVTGNDLYHKNTADLETCIDYFIGTDQFQSYFINDLVPWGRFRGTPNNGHFAIADFLGCGVLENVTTTNFDSLIEKAADDLGEDDFVATVDEDDLNRPANHSPLLKIHGCCVRNRRETIWSKKQLENPIISDKLKKMSNWIDGQLRGRDILIIGFWTDWEYLNDILISSISLLEPRKVVIINPSPIDDLARKAPQLWAWVSGGNVNLCHVPVSASEFLDELRRRFSLQFLRRLLGNSVELFESLTGKQLNRSFALDELDNIDLYSKRRDFCGQSGSEIVRIKRPEVYHNPAGAMHLIILEYGGVIQGSLYRFNGQTVRIINGNGKLISQLRRNFSKDPPELLEVDLFICVGAYSDGGSKADILREGTSQDIIRRKTSGEWIPDQAFFSRIGLNQNENC